MAERLGAITLTGNRRQVHSWEKEALEAIREGRPGEALTAYQERGAIVVHETADQLRKQMVADWLKARDVGEDVRMIARRRQEVAELNRRARAALKERGQVSGPELQLDGVCFAVGDEVVTRQNDRRLGVLNGTSGKVVAIDCESDRLTMRIEKGREVTLPADYLRVQRSDGIPYLMHAYATTAHLAQGATCDRALVMAGDDISREWGYVALSRGRSRNRLYTVQQLLPEAETTHARQRPADPLERVAQSLLRSEAKQMAISPSSSEANRSPAKGLRRREGQVARLQRARENTRPSQQEGGAGREPSVDHASREL